MATDPRDRYAEYRGKDGLIQTAEDGHVELTVKEKAMLGRMYGKAASQGAEPNEIAAGTDSVTGETWEDASQRRIRMERDGLLKKTNGRGIEEA